MKKLFRVCLASTIMLLFFNKLFANDAPLVLIGTTVSPIISKDIVMENETIKVTLSKFEASVNCLFTFYNSGDEKSVMMGFPEAKSYLNTSDLHDFTTVINNKNNVSC